MLLGRKHTQRVAEYLSSDGKHLAHRVFSSLSEMNVIPVAFDFDELEVKQICFYLAHLRIGTRLRDHEPVAKCFDDIARGEVLADVVGFRRAPQRPQRDADFFENRGVQSSSTRLTA